MHTLVIVLPDEVMDRVRRLAAARGTELSAVVAAVVADATARPTSERTQPAEVPVEQLDEQSSTVRGPQSGISVRLRWDLIGRGQAEVVREPKASATMRRVMERLSEVLGLETLERLAAYRVNRGPLLSRNPDADYAASNGVQYSSHPVGVTGWHVLTHSATEEKVTALRGLPEHLGQPAGFIEVEQFEK